MTSINDYSYNSSSDYAQDLTDDVLSSVKSMFTLVMNLETQLERIKGAYIKRSNNELTEQELMDILDELV
jgi:hypothetical protein